MRSKVQRILLLHPTSGRVAGSSLGGERADAPTLQSRGDWQVRRNYLPVQSASRQLKNYMQIWILMILKPVQMVSAMEPV